VVVVGGSSCRRSSSSSCLIFSLALAVFSCVLQPQFVLDPKILLSSSAAQKGCSRAVPPAPAPHRGVARARGAFHAPWRRLRTPEGEFSRGIPGAVDGHQHGRPRGKAGAKAPLDDAGGRVPAASLASRIGALARRRCNPPAFHAPWRSMRTPRGSHHCLPGLTTAGQGGRRYMLPAFHAPWQSLRTPERESSLHGWRR